MKRKLETAAAAVVTAGAISITAFASSKKYTPADLKDLGDSLLGRSAVSAGQDVNMDGRVDVMDMVEMRKSLLSTGVFAEKSFYASEENVKFIGRNYVDDSNITWLVQSGSAVEFTVNARSAEITVHGDKGIRSDEIYRPRYAVIVDDEIIEDALMSESSKTIKLFDCDSPRTAHVKVIHLSEANNGAVGISEIKLDTDSVIPVLPAPKKGLSIEFIGDSITCAYGVEGKDNYESFKTSTENFMKSYAYLAAEKLNADYSAVCYSGHGIISGYTSDAKNTEALLPPYYEMIGKPQDYRKPWDFSKHHNDVVVINLGTNDSSFIDKDFEARSDEFTAEYEKFLGVVRKNNPDAYIICTLGTMGAENEFSLIEQAILNFKNNTGDERITSYKSVVQNPADGFGSDWHPSALTQKKSAYVLADMICQVLGMESDQIGLDIASDASYDVKTNDDGSVYAAAYFSDYDKSYWINMTSGGKQPSDIEAVISNIKLRSNGKYRLSFKCTTAEGIELPVIIRSKNSSDIYYEGVFTSNGDKTPFESEFTASADDSAEIIVQVGGHDSYSVTLYELHLEKIG